MGSDNDPNAMIDAITAATIQSVPWLTDPVTESIRNLADASKITRVKEVLDNVISRLSGFHSELSELYVKTPGFRKLLFALVRAVADERAEEKRTVYAAFLFSAVVSPLDSMEKQLRVVNIIKEMKTDHIRLIRTMGELSPSQTSYAQSPLQMLQTRLPDLPRDRLEGLLHQMTDLGIIDIADWSAVVSGGPEQVRKSMTIVGQRLVRLITEIKRPK